MNKKSKHNKKDNRGRKREIYWEFEIHRENNSTFFKIILTNNVSPIVLGRIDFFKAERLQSITERLSLALYRLGSPSAKKSNLISLAEEGFKAYKEFIYQLKKVHDGPDFYNKIWQKEIANKKNDSPLEVLFLYSVFDGINFPLGLFYIPSVNWENRDFDIKDYLIKLRPEEIVTGFLDFKSIIITMKRNNAFARLNLEDYSNNLKGLVDSDNGGEMLPRVLHGYDSNLERANSEIDYWKSVQEVKEYVTGSRFDLCNIWFDNPNPRIIHFTSHLNYNEELGYNLSLCNGESLDFEYFRQQINGRNSLIIKPLVFINSCRAGYPENNNFHNEIIEELFPNFSRGFVAPIHAVSDLAAYEFAVEFYNNFIKNNFPIWFSFNQAKKALFKEEKYEILGYGLWNVESTLIFKTSKIHQ